MLGFILLILFIFSLLIYLVSDYRGPKRIIIRPHILFNLKCFRAKELIIQETDNEGNVWASRGSILYLLKVGENYFTRVSHVPTGLSYYWLNNFSLFRKFTYKPECLEVTITDQGQFCAMSGGYMWNSSGVGKKFYKTMKLNQFGVGVGRGIFSNGLLAVNNGMVYFGEYFRNQERTSVNIYQSRDNGLTWEVAFTFEPGTIKHIHALQKDPFTGRLWVCTGDEDDEAMIAWSENGFNSINQIGSGSQLWRTTQLAFTEDAIYWGSDTGSVELSGIYRWDKSLMKVERLHNVNGGILFGTKLNQDTLVFSSDREGFLNEKDKRTRLFVFNKSEFISETEVGTWNHWERGFRFSFALLRMQRSQGSNQLAVTVLNHKEFQNGDLLLFNEEDICI